LIYLGSILLDDVGGLCNVIECLKMSNVCFLLMILPYNCFYVSTICSFFGCHGELARVYFGSRSSALFSLCSMWRWTCALWPRRLVVPCSMIGLPASVISGLHLFLRRFLVLHISRVRLVLVKPCSLLWRFVYSCNLCLYAFLQLLVSLWWCVEKLMRCSCSIL
jgi:hypothetical protein